MPSELPDPNEETGENRKAEPDAPPSNTRLPAHEIRRPRPQFLDELDENPRLALGDKRYTTFRKQLTWLGIVGLATAGAILYLILRYESEKLDPVPSSAAQAKPAAATREPDGAAQVAALRDSLRQAGQSRDWPKIEDLAGQVLKVSPTDGEAWNYLGWVYEKSGNTQQAIDAYGKAIADGFLPPMVHLKRASLYRAAGDYAEALAEIDRSIQLDNESNIAPNLQMIFLIESGKIEEARAMLRTRESLENTPSQYLLGAAALALRNGEPAKAAGLLEQLRPLLLPPVFAQLMDDPFFEPYRNEPALRPFFMIGGS